jgi:hypothetical protein
MGEVLTDCKGGTFSFESFARSWKRVEYDDSVLGPGLSKNSLNMRASTLGYR